MLQPLQPLGGAGPVGAAVHDLARHLYHRRAAGRAVRGHPPGSLPLSLVALDQVRADHLRDHVAGPLHDHGVTLADVLAVDVLFVVERGHRDGDAAHHHRLHHGVGVERAGATHVHADSQQLRQHRGGSELEGDRPARVAVDRPQRSLLGVARDLDHTAVDVVVDVLAPCLPCPAGLERRLHRVVQLDPLAGAEALLAEPGQRLPVRLQRKAAVRADLVGEYRQRPRGRDRRILLAQGARRGVARVHERG